MNCSRKIRESGPCQGFSFLSLKSASAEALFFLNLFVVLSLRSICAHALFLFSGTHLVRGNPYLSPVPFLPVQVT